MNGTPAKLLNVGCGRHYHPAWRNVDLHADDPRVLVHDLRQGIPFDTDLFDAVYHSHVLEHLRIEEGRRLIAECYRVLRPGGVLRVVVPDLEGIARAYLQAIDRMDRGSTAAIHDHHWMQLELFDQLVRAVSGGEMGRVMSDPEWPNREFVASRMGAELEAATPGPACSSASSSGSPPPQPRASWWQRRRRRLVRRLARCGDRLRRSIVRRLYGEELMNAFDEARFRRSGEIHQWMYDRHSLGRLLREAGFARVAVRSAFESEIPGFDGFDLDAIGNRVRKPDSLFVEAIKPARAAVRAA